MKNRPIHILAGLGGGIAAGLTARMLFGGHPMLTLFNDNVAYFIGQLFLRLIFMAVVPLVVCSLVLGIVEMGDVRRLGRVGLRCLGFTALLSLTSVLVGIGLVAVVRPGDQVPTAVREELRARMQVESARAIAHAMAAMRPVDAVLALVPKNPLQAAVQALEGEMLSLMVFALVVGMALVTLPPEKARPVVALAESMLAVSMRVVEFAMALAPFAVAALLFSLVVRTGVDLMVSLASYVLVVVGGLALQCFGVYSLALRFVAGVSPMQFFGSVREAMLTAFSTASSNATLPVTLRVAEEELHIPRRIGNFVLTVGATANQNGTALFEGVTVLFLAQLFGIVLAWPQQLVVVLMSVLAGVGTAGVPGGSIPLIVIVLQSVGIPSEGIAVILGLDRLLDMCRTTLNVTGDLVIATLVAQGESADPPATIGV